MAIRLRNKRAEKHLSEFTGGLNDIFNSVLLNDNEASDCQNVIFDEKGTIAKRKGMVARNTGALTGKIDGLWAYYQRSGSTVTPYLLYVRGGTLYKLESDGTETSLATGLASGKRMRSTNYLNKTYFLNGTDALRQYDGTSVSLVAGTPPTGSLIANHKNYMFIAGNTSAPQRIYWSALGDPTNWPATNWLDVPFSEGDVITAILPFRDALLICGNTSIWMLLGDANANFTLRKYNDEYGSVNQETAQIVQNTAFMLSRLGPVAFDGARAILLGEKIGTAIKSINQAVITEAWAINHNGKYICSVPTNMSATNNLELVYDYLRTAWTKFAGRNLSAYTVYAPAGIDLPYAGDVSNGRIYELDQGYNDNGAAIDAYWDSKTFDFGFPEAKKKFISMYVFVKSESAAAVLDVYADNDYTGYELVKSINLQGSSTDWDSADWDLASWDGSSLAASQRADFSSRAKHTRIRVRNNGVNQPFSLYRISFLMKIKPPRK